MDGHCFYDTYEGHRFPDYGDWEGMQTAKEQGDRIGMLPDLDQGSMTVWKIDEKLGMMHTDGLSGPYCWAVTVYRRGDSARLDSAPAPASPTEEELAAAKVWQRGERLGLLPTATDAECEAAEAAHCMVGGG